MDGNNYNQNQLAISLEKKLAELTSLLSQSMRIHLNLGQQYTLNTSNVFFSLEPVAIKSLSDREIRSVGNGTIRFPSQFQLTSNTELISDATLMRVSLLLMCLLSIKIESVFV